MWVYLAVEIYDDGRVVPRVDVMSSMPNYTTGAASPMGNTDLATIRQGARVTERVLDFAHSLESDGRD